MRRTSAAPALFLAAVALTGCADSTDQGKPAESAQPTTQSPQPAPAPRTAADLLARAEEAMTRQKGWTFTVRGREGLLLQGQENAATYTATVHRTTGAAWALHSTGATLSKGVREPEEIYVAEGTAYVKKGTAVWEHGPLDDPEFANKVEDPLAALDAFQEYGDEVTVSAVQGHVELRVRIPSARLSDSRHRPALAKAAREFRPTLDRLRDAGVAASERDIVLNRLEEVLVLDAATFRITSHRFAFGFLIPYQGQRVTYRQEVSEQNRGVFEGTVARPAGVTD
ncbi:hypothetical protein [Streptomyces coerulescens]|uniref:Lipoprotein n=1 Tax=Streptomyces coerulescens TaxID=29304 RepID=A0ABW0CE44_STRCD